MPRTELDAFAGSSGEEAGQKSWPRIERAEIIRDGLAVGILLREFDGTISAIQITADQLAD